MTLIPSEYSRSVTWPLPVPDDDAAYSGRVPDKVAGSRQPWPAREASSLPGELAVVQAGPDATLADVLGGRTSSVPIRTCVNRSSLTSLADVSKVSRCSGTIVLSS